MVVAGAVNVKADDIAPTVDTLSKGFGRAREIDRGESAIGIIALGIIEPLALAEQEAVVRGEDNVKKLRRIERGFSMGLWAEIR